MDWTIRLPSTEESAVTQDTPLHHVVIVGGGFAGLYAGKALRRAPVRVTLVDRRNFHLFQPLLYQVATGGVSAGDIAYPLRSIFARDRHFSVIMAEVTDIDVAQRTVILREGSLTYDTLILAPGSTNQYFGHDDWAQQAPALKTIEDALEIRRRIFLAFEAAEREPDPEKRRALMTFVIVGGGPTGVELAGTL
jgi:NADH:ubiquinone reductase (H+-translocating)